MWLRVDGPVSMTSLEAAPKGAHKKKVAWGRLVNKKHLPLMVQGQRL